MRVKVIAGFYSYEHGRILEKDETADFNDERGKGLIALGLASIDEDPETPAEDVDPETPAEDVDPETPAEDVDPETPAEDENPETPAKKKKK